MQKRNKQTVVSRTLKNVHVPMILFNLKRQYVNHASFFSIFYSIIKELLIFSEGGSDFAK